jgi:hypothetical protein
MNLEPRNFVKIFEEQEFTPLHNRKGSKRTAGSEENDSEPA